MTRTEAGPISLPAEHRGLGEVRAATESGWGVDVDALAATGLEKPDGEGFEITPVIGGCFVGQNDAVDPSRVAEPLEVGRTVPGPASDKPPYVPPALPPGNRSRPVGPGEAAVTAPGR